MTERKLKVKIAASVVLVLSLSLISLHSDNYLLKTIANEGYINTIEKKVMDHAHSNSTTTDSLILTKDKSKETPPLYFIMHVGPPKTGTTSLQCSLRYLEEKKLLPKNISIMETQACCPLAKNKTKPLKQKLIADILFNVEDTKRLVKTHIMDLCLNRWNGKGMPKCWNSGYLPYIQKQEKQNKSIIVSKEVMSFLIGRDIRKKEEHLKKRYQFWDDFTDSIGPRFHTVILITYRNFFEWIYSYYTEKNKHMNRPYLYIWPAKGGRVIPTIHNYVEQNLKSQESDRRIFFPDYLLEKFSKKQTNSSKMSIKIINMDHGDDVKEEFFCRGLPSSFHMCDLVNKIIIPKQNKAPNYLWCDILATEAHEHSLITSKISRRKAFKQIKEFQEEKGLSCNDFAKACPSDDFYDRLFKTSMNLHYKIFPHDYTNGTIERLYREKYEKVKYKFCTLNATAVFEDEDWRLFLSNL